MLINAKNELKNVVPIGIQNAEKTVVTLENNRVFVTVNGVDVLSIISTDNVVVTDNRTVEE